MKKFILTILGLIFISGSLTAQTVLPVIGSEQGFVYDRLEREQILSGYLGEIHLGPFSDFNNSNDFEPFSYLQNKDQNRLSLFGYATENFSARKYYHSNAYESLRGGFAGHPLNNIFLYANFILDEQKAEDSAYTGKKWRGLAGGVESAFINFSFSQGYIRAGRFSSFWGIRQSLILSPKNQLDGLEYHLKWGRLGLTYRLAELDNFEIDIFNDVFRRYLAAHRLDLFLAKNLRIGFFETVIFGGSGRTIDLNYLNPILFFHSDQLNDNINDNISLGFDASYIYKNKIYLYGQLLVDDFQIENKSAGDNEPDQYALRVGSQVVGIKNKLDLELSYTRITYRTFSQSLAINKYLFEGNPIGDVLGNDYDQLTLEAKYWHKPVLAFGLLFDYLRRGEGRIEDHWSPVWNWVEDYSEPFPTGTVEKTLTLALLAEGFVFDHVYFNIKTGLQKIDNHNHNVCNDVRLGFINLTLSTFFDQPLNLAF